MNLNRLEYKGKSITEWSQETGLAPKTIRNRLNRGQSWEQAITPIFDIECRTDNLGDISRRLASFGNTIIRKNEQKMFGKQLQQAGYLLKKAKKDNYFIVTKGEV